MRESFIIHVPTKTSWFSRFIPQCYKYMWKIFLVPLIFTFCTTSWYFIIISSNIVDTCYKDLTNIEKFTAKLASHPRTENVTKWSYFLCFLSEIRCKKYVSNSPYRVDLYKYGKEKSFREKQKLVSFLLRQTLFWNQVRKSWTFSMDQKV